MQQFIKTQKIKLFLILLIIIGAFLRLYNLNWGAPYYFHPDERNIASSVSQLNFPSQMNPHFFAYGSFPIYIIYFLGVIENLFLNCKLHVIFACPESLSLIDVGAISIPKITIIKFEQAIIISRLISAILSISLIPLIYFIGQILKDKAVGIFAAIITTFSVGFIQFAHFGTFEIWITFFSLLFFYLNLNLLKNNSFKNIILLGIILGILNAVKISNLTLMFLPILVIFLSFFKNKPYYQYTGILVVIQLIVKLLILISIAFLTLIILSPFFVLDFYSAFSTFKYESLVALGTLPVFYTQEFFNTIPVFFQFVKIYPFILNPLLTILFIPSFVYLIYITIKYKNLSYCILNTIYVILFVPNAFLFAKWTRYVIPTLPFIYLIISMFLNALFQKTKTNLYCKYTGIFAVISISIIFAFSYFLTVFIKPDARITASNWAKNNLSAHTNILSEIYDLGITAFNPDFINIKLFNFYDLDNKNPEKNKELQTTISSSNYIILPSQRIIKTRLINEEKFPIGYSFYKSLIEEKTQFKKIYETPCDIFCKITYLNDPIFSFEQTANVFDRPTVFIFKRD